MKIKCSNNRSIMIRNKEEETFFACFGNSVSVDRGTDTRINKARITANMLKKIWSSQIISRTQLKIFNSNVKSVLLHF